MNRREMLIGSAAAGAALTLAPVRAARPASGDEELLWVSTGQSAPWRTMPGPQLTTLDPNMFGRHLEVRLDRPEQPIEGFGGAFGEKGWEALQLLPARERDAALDALFGSGNGAGFTLCRTPIGANDIARRWYSYDERDGDFALEHFSVANDRETLIPFIRAALQRQPALRLWASPWSPPTWMKTNRHYAMAPAWPYQPSNGIRPDQVGREGADHFIQEDRYFDAYARYFRRYVEDYRRHGITIAMVMPQNEFNSAQPFPSCCWTPAGLARFIPYLGREMAKVDVDIFFGTLERANADLVSRVLADPQAGPLIKGVGVQWAGKGALAAIRMRHPDLAIWGSEQECGFGTNDWHYMRYGWGLMKHYFLHGARAWHYWNMVMPAGGLSGWGWPQNSLVVVDPATRSWRLTNDYWLMRHASGFVLPGARRLPTESFMGFENQLAFRNPDGSVAILVQNEMADPLEVRMKVGERQLNLMLPADSLNSIRIPAARLV